MTVAEHLILYVDDERGNRVVFQHSFAKTFRVRAVESAKEALELMETEPVAVLVADQRMPEMSGNELLMRAKTLHPEIIRIVVTAYSDLDPILQAVNDGLVARYVIKPWDRAELEDTLRWALAAYEMGRIDADLRLRLLQNERLATIGGMAATVMHDIREPLVHLHDDALRLAQLAKASREALQKALRRRGETLAPAARKSLEDLATDLPEIAEAMTAGSELLLGVTREISDIIRKERPCSEPVEVDPLPIIRFTISVCSGTVRKAKGTLTYDGPDGLPNIRIARADLGQILINLLLNAAHALESNEARRGRVILSASEATGAVHFSVEDDGCGMSEEVLKKIGTPFFSTRSEGTGLGVSQCRRLIERAGGTLRIESAAGRGTTVSFDIPKAKG